MANSYLLFSFHAFENLTRDECLWIEPYLDPEWWENNHYEGHMGFEMSIDGQNRLWVYAEEAGSVDNVAWFLNRFLKAHRPRNHVVFGWCHYCNQPRVDEFGGGACLVTAREIVWFYPESLAREYLMSRGCQPLVEDHGDAVDKLKESVDGL